MCCFFVTLKFGPSYCFVHPKYEAWLDAFMTAWFRFTFLLQLVDFWLDFTNLRLSFLAYCWKSEADSGLLDFLASLCPSYLPCHRFECLWCWINFLSLMSCNLNSSAMLESTGMVCWAWTFFYISVKLKRPANLNL